MPIARGRRLRPGGVIDVDRAFYGGANLADVVRSRLTSASNFLGGTSYSADIRNLQSTLNVLPSSLPKLVVDGLFGPKTKARIEEFQRANGLAVNGDPNDSNFRARLFSSGLPSSAPPPPVAASDYYVKGTPFLWLAQGVGVRAFSYPLSFNPFPEALQAFKSSLSAHGYNVRVVGLDGESLEVSGSQNIDRAHATDARDQISSLAQQAGLTWSSSLAVQFNVQRAGSSFQVGTPGATANYGDRTPVQTKDALTELGLNPFSNDKGATRNIPGLDSLSGGTGTIIVVIVAGLLIAKVLRG